MQVYHDSRDQWYRQPGGALPCGRRTHLRVMIHGERAPRAVILRVWRDGEQRIPMVPMEGVPGGFCYEADLEAGAEPGLVWYRFEIEDWGTHIVYGNAADRLGGVGEQGSYDSYQVTVYDPAFDPPHWLREGVMYQVMVDRFAHGDSTGKLFAGRKDIVRHAHWQEAPFLSVEPNGDNLANDFFGGDLLGLRDKLPYLKGLGITVLYLNPIFRARTNHKYDVGDYETIDPMFGTNADFVALCDAAAGMGIRVMLDGVFSHVGADSRYFNRYGTYPELGAYQSKQSPYYDWFTFRQHPQEYISWWGFETLPELRKDAPGCVEYLLTGKNAILGRWLAAGASGWRLDVADELPMPFLRTLRAQAKAARADAAVLGEVWEDASNKVAYDQLRSYALGDTVDSVMNYPLRDALIAFFLGHEPAQQCKRRLDALGENYPRPFFYSLMNLLGSHDRARILNMLVDCTGEELPREKRRDLCLTQPQRILAMARLKLALRLVAVLPGMPCVYYGDEAGMEGAADPFCRGTYPWGEEDRDLLAYFAAELQRRHTHPVWSRGDWILEAPHEDVLALIRTTAGGRDAFGEVVPAAAVLCVINRGDQPRTVSLPADVLGQAAWTALDGGAVPVLESGAWTCRLAAHGSMLSLSTEA